MEGDDALGHREKTSTLTRASDQLASNKKDESK
jgi:hypothetical protein